MPNYCFTTFERGSPRAGEVIEFDDLPSARRAATDYAGALVQEIDGELFDHDLTLEVADAEGRMLWFIRVTAAEGAAARREQRPDDEEQPEC